MGSFVESLKRLYKKGSLTKSHINSLKERGRITHEEMEYILSAVVESE